ncbi:LCP family protein [Streptococcus sp. zg-JUN1979]|uniref:LCP family glycopolymer transferase CpsA n=1 Tax=Streptococcus sp. zg-JUN1979 TaxID=3391450 RepID=UPI0039A5F72D
MARSSRRRNRYNGSRKGDKTSRLSILNIALAAVYAVLTGLSIFTMYSYNFLAFRYVNVGLTALLLAVFILVLMLILSGRAKKTTTGLLVGSSLLSLGLFLGFRYAVNIGENVNKSTFYSEVEMSVVVPKDSSINSLEEISSLAVPLSSDHDNITTFLNHLKTDKQIDLPRTEVDSYQKAYSDMMDGSVQAMVLNSAYSSLLELQDEGFSSNLKTLYSYKIKKETGTSTQEAAGDSFNIYISGIDTYGSISTVSRSDVNIIMTVNLKTHKILLTTTPRDSYVQIPDGGNNQYDKLTHAGIYGVDTSRKTLENLYGISIPYYVRLNFTSFLQLIDELGGIEVYNDQAFTSYHDHYTFEAGNIQLDSKQALEFVRERYSLEGGDNDRGKNQEKVIAAIINKLAQPSSLTKISGIVDDLQTSIQTNMPLSEVMAIANTQLSSGGKFTVTSQSVTGVGSTGELSSYAMPTASLYMMQLNQDSIDQAKAAIETVLNGN